MSAKALAWLHVVVLLIGASLSALLHSPWPVLFALAIFVWLPNPGARS